MATRSSSIFIVRELAGESIATRASFYDKIYFTFFGTPHALRRPDAAVRTPRSWR